MNKAATTISENMAGIQLAVFELIWPTFPWIDSIYIDTTSHKYCVFVYAKQVQVDSEWNDCVRLLSEIFDEILQSPSDYSITADDRESSTSNNFIEIMSQPIFKTIAKQVAPWRLDADR